MPDPNIEDGPRPTWGPPPWAQSPQGAQWVVHAQSPPSNHGMTEIVKMLITALVALIIGGGVGYGSAPREVVDTAVIESKLQNNIDRVDRFETNVTKEIVDVRGEISKLSDQLRERTIDSNAAQRSFSEVFRRLERLERLHDDDI